MRDSNLSAVYGAYPYTAIDKGLNDRHRAREAEKADQLFVLQRYPECRDLCYEILQVQPSEAIRARCHAYLAMEPIYPGHPAERSYHATMAVRAWQIVIERTGSSRFSVDKAKIEQEVAQNLFAAAKKDMDKI